MLIHPQYIIGICDSNKTEFKIIKKYNTYSFEINTYLPDIQILYKIKERFKTGKIIKLKNGYCLKISKNLDNIIQFYFKNKLLNKYQHITFLRWQYLYQKLIIEKDTVKTIKEVKKINKRLSYFYVI